MTPAVLTLADLAALFRRAPATIGARVRAWRRHDGFPPPLPGTRLWSAEQVMTWIDADPAARRRLPALLAANDDTNPVVAADRARLEARYGLGAS